MRMDYENYPDNYDFLSDEEYNEILDYLNEGEPGYEDGQRCSQEHRDYAHELQQRGIAARYDWSGDRRQWILADYARAEAEEDWWWQCADYD